MAANQRRVPCGQFSLQSCWSKVCRTKTKMYFYSSWRSPEDSMQTLESKIMCQQKKCSNTNLKGVIIQTEGLGFDSQGSAIFFHKHCFPNLHWIHDKSSWIKYTLKICFNRHHNQTIKTIWGAGPTVCTFSIQITIMEHLQTSFLEVIWVLTEQTFPARLSSNNICRSVAKEN